MIDLSEIISFLQPIKTIGETERSINRLVSVLDEKAFSDDELFWISDKNRKLLGEIKQGNIICSPFDDSDIQLDCTYVVVENPRLAFQKVLGKFFVKEKPPIVSDSAKIHPSAKLGERCSIGENVVIEENCVVGDDCVIGHNTVMHSGTVVEDSVKIGSNCVVGGVGFGYERDEMGEYQLIHHIGNVVLKKNVEVGNCTCIDRAVLGSTILEENVKVDNLVHIAHGVKIGKNSLVIANAMIGGSTVIEENVWVAPSTSLLNKIKIEKNSIIGMGAVVIKNVEESATVVGNPAKRIK